MYYNSKIIPEFILDCCNVHKFNIIFDENNFHLLTNCNENEFKLWKIPKNWTGEIIKKNKLKSYESIFVFDEKNIFKSDENKEINNNFFEDEEDEYNSSLDGWDEEITKEESTKNAINNFFSL